MAVPRRRRGFGASAIPAALLLLVGGSACSRPATGDADVRVDLRVTPQPPVTGLARLEVALRDAAGRPFPAAGVAVEGNMTHPGMRPTFAAARRAGQGRWLADLELTMPGDWVVTVVARLDDGRSVERTFPLPGVAAR